MGILYNVADMSYRERAYTTPPFHSLAHAKVYKMKKIILWFLLWLAFSGCGDRDKALPVAVERYQTELCCNGANGDPEQAWGAGLLRPDLQAKGRHWKGEKVRT